MLRFALLAIGVALVDARRSRGRGTKLSSELREQFDADVSGGKLDEAERDALKAQLKQNYLDRVDTDMDGTVSEAEKAAAKAAKAAAAKQAKLDKYDTDGDGTISEEEKPDRKRPTGKGSRSRRSRRSRR